MVGINDGWIAYQFDSAIALVGNGIEVAAQEMEKVGSSDKPEWKQKYTMEQLLSDDFRLPLPTKLKEQDAMDTLRSWASIPGAVKVFKAKSNNGDG